MHSELLHPAYFEIRFRSETLPSQWPGKFAIITAFATTGEQWSEEKNETADRLLLNKILDRGLWHSRLTGYSPQDKHNEPGWAVETSLEEARRLGREFLQDAIYWISGDELWVTKCTDGSTLVGVGSFRERLDAAQDPATL